MTKAQVPMPNDTRQRFAGLYTRGKLFVKVERRSQHSASNKALREISITVRLARLPK